ncbi:AzlD domain-containing protein [Streptomyces sp. NPDC006367]|uniref:branched-chain amino acid transporter permease n=1 Tax=unclassified Streptomyces TaxID=2593676 RepID=UPI0033AB5FCD
MPETSYVMGAVLVMAVVTLALRSAPFLLLRNVSSSPLLGYLSTALPPGIMVILVVYTVRGVEFDRYPYGLPAIAGIAVCAGLYHWRGNPLLAIVLGTGAHMALLHFLA